MSLQKKEINAALVINESVKKRFKHRRGEKDFNYVDRRQPELKILADHDRIVQVLTILLSNAIKYSPENSEIKSAPNRRPTPSCHFKVTDSGPGIPADKQSKIFLKFQQIDSTNSRIKDVPGWGWPSLKT